MGFVRIAFRHNVKIWGRVFGRVCSTGLNTEYQDTEVNRIEILKKNATPPPPPRQLKTGAQFNLSPNDAMSYVKEIKATSKQKFKIGNGGTCFGTMLMIKDFENRSG